LPFTSTLCGACYEVCPVKINIPKILVALRRRYAEDPDWGPTGLTLEKGIFGLYSRIMGNKSHYEKCLQILKKTQSLLMKNGSLRYLPPPFDRWGQYHDVSPLHEKPFRESWAERKKWSWE
jgi:L-lactate dehydrogenase complex protein LldF